jgi:hypothetical protein
MVRAIRERAGCTMLEQLATARGQAENLGRFKGVGWSGRLYFQSGPIFPILRLTLVAN